MSLPAAVAPPTPPGPAFVRDQLRALLAGQGPAILDDPRRFEALLRDLSGEHRREAHLLVSALREALSRAGIKVEGRAVGLRWPEAPSAATVKIGEVRSAPLREMVAAIMKLVGAEQLPPGTALLLKIVYGASLAILVTPPGLRRALAAEN